MATIGIDPMLAADEQIYRSSEEVKWRRVETEVTAFAGRWHQAGKIDRAIRFRAIVSGRPEFAELAWPFIETKDNQLRIFCGCRARRSASRPSTVAKDRERLLAYFGGGAALMSVQRTKLGEIAGAIAEWTLAWSWPDRSLAKVDADVEVRPALRRAFTRCVFGAAFASHRTSFCTGPDTLWERVAQDS